MREHRTGLVARPCPFEEQVAVRRGVMRTTVRALAVGLAGAFFLAAAAPAALAHVGEEGVPAVTDVQEAIAILASHQGSFPQAEIIDHALDKAKDAQESTNTRGVDLDLVRQAQAALESNDLGQAEVLLERSIGACPGAPVINPETAPRTPPPLPSPCPTYIAHLRGLSSTPVGGAQEPVFLAVAGVMIMAGLALVRKIR